MVKRTTKKALEERWESLEEDLREIGVLLRGGMTPEQALSAFRRHLDEEGLRDIFAAIALHRFVERIALEDGTTETASVARMAYDAADAMLKERGAIRA